MHLKISQLADQVRDTPLRNVLAHCRFDLKREGRTLRAKTDRHNIVVTGSRWFDNKANVSGGGAIDLVMHIAGVDFSVACRSLVDDFRPIAQGQASLSFPSSSGCQTAPEKKSFEELMARYAVQDELGPQPCGRLIASSNSSRQTSSRRWCDAGSDMRPS
jgi:hypothetical protein